MLLHRKQILKKKTFNPIVSYTTLNVIYFIVVTWCNNQLIFIRVRDQNYQIILVAKFGCYVHKQYRPRWDAEFCGISFRSTRLDPYIVYFT